MVNFTKHKTIYFIVSGLLLCAGVASLFLWGLKPSIDFSGGTIFELRFEGSEESQVINDRLRNDVISVQKTGERTYLLRMPPISEGEKPQVVAELKKQLGEFEEIRFETVGPTLGKELLTKTLVAAVLGMGFILAYVAWRFKDLMYGVCAILGMLHDTLLLIGSFSILGHFFGVEVDTLFVTAVLTILSFSVHDTVVIFDTVREQAGKRRRRADFSMAVDQALGETLVRSLNNSLTIIFMLLALALLGGESIRWFVVALLIGTIAGTYSSSFFAAPLLVVWDRLAAKRRKV